MISLAQILTFVRTYKASGIISIIFCCFHLYTGFMGLLPGLDQRIVHLGFALLITSCLIIEDDEGIWNKAVGVGLMISSLAASGYAFIEAENAIGIRAGLTLPGDIIMGVVLTVSLLEATRRLMGAALPIICIVFLAFGFFGYLLPNMIAHRGYDLERVAQQLYLSNEGFYGLPLGVSANYLILFIIYGAVLNATGAGKFFIDISFAMVGWARGGPAKMAVAGSALFGSISGSSVANVAATGTLSIPLMKKVGLRPSTAGAIEAVASCGGQVMPPIMGAAAFLIAEIVGVSYGQVLVAATIPGILYFASLFIAVDLRAQRMNIKGIPKSELMSARELMRDNYHLLLSPCLLVYLITIEERSPLYAAVWSIVAALVVATFRKHTRPTLGRLVDAFSEAGRQGIVIAVACATAGIIVGIFSLTGLGFKISSLLITISDGNLAILLLCTMVVSLILGTGLPTVPAYLLLAVLVAPALAKIGVELLAAHLFIFYFGVFSGITPPLALAAFVGAGIAGANPMRTAVEAFRIGIAAFLLPFLFVYKPALLMMGDPVSILFAIVESLLGIFAFIAGIEGFLLNRLSIILRLLLIVSGILLVSNGVLVTTGGIALFLLVLAYQYLARSKFSSTRNNQQT
ncbi:TRAP transporter fused permease subunit [Sneathiella chungangensis]|uniref:TRAP transporter fused permease subunit n=1 Tax=Sneathiella chungangensis TaxID=1418234 RepID=A0A845MLC0_9PROT|nr:TRAP transporter permease [Sneathiella chungangensis]MZR23887.1 TRAP transporter fused permease subunit [Sneathiella chungangensis]